MMGAAMMMWVVLALCTLEMAAEFQVTHCCFLHYCDYSADDGSSDDDVVGAYLLLASSDTDTVTAESQVTQLLFSSLL